MSGRARQVIITALAGVVLTGGAVVAAQVATQHPGTTEGGRQAALSATAGDTTPGQLHASTPSSTVHRAEHDRLARHPAAQAGSADDTKADQADNAKSLPSGIATATSFWDAQTASGKPMRYQTIASPYWPLGTKVKITYRSKSVIGFIEDFGPAEWAVAQHDIPAIVDLSEKMMADLTGVRSNVIHVRFEVLKWGTGRVYRTSGTGYDLAMGRL